MLHEQILHANHSCTATVHVLPNKIEWSSALIRFDVFFLLKAGPERDIQVAILLSLKPTVMLL